MKRFRIEPHGSPRFPTHWGRSTASYLRKFEQSPLEFAGESFERGYHLVQEGKQEEANWVFRATIETLEEWHNIDPKTVSFDMLAGIALRHGARLMRLRGVFKNWLPDAQTAFRSAAFYADSARELGASAGVVEVLASSLSWYGLASRCAGEFPDALEAYKRSSGLWRSLIVVARDRSQNVSYQRALAGSLFGISRTLPYLGKFEEAARARTESSELFRKARP